jgi:hypothetical protein
MAVEHLHDCRATWVRADPVHEIFNGKTIWKGMVEVFSLTGHPKAFWAYAWSHKDGPQDKDERFVTVLELPPVDSAQAAVKIVAAKEIKDAKKDLK